MNLNELNEAQIQAVTTNAKHVLIIAGAGTGKTKTIVSRISYLIEQGIEPQNILGLTFSNKAAKEMSDRINLNLPDKHLTIKTFHSFGVQLLRKYGKFTDHGSDFVIYDDEDTKKLISKIAKSYNAASYIRDIKQSISFYKQNLTNTEINRPYDFYKIFEEYQKQMKEANAYDFDDLLLEPIILLQNQKLISNVICEQYKYILIDEYQDTNQAQFELLRQISNQNSYIMVVGDEDQSIYKFRGADINNILEFKNQFDNVEIIKLQQNYRCTHEILETANNIIQNNIHRLGKTLITDVHGNKPIFMDYNSDKDEANAIAQTIIQDNLSLKDTAIIYRTNALGRQIEQAMLAKSIDYIVYGSVALFDKEEIKDCLAIIKWLLNPNDKIAFERFINKPARGLGAKALATFYEFAQNNNEDLYTALQNAGKLKDTKTSKILSNVAQIFYNKKEEMLSDSLVETIGYIFDNLGLTEYYKGYDDGDERLSNVQELLNYLSDDKKSLQDILDDITLEPSEKTSADRNAVKLMTAHNAKGLEFDNVFIYGLSENVFPHINAIQSEDEDEIEEERRLCYVAITRARKKLYMTHSNSRFMFDGFQKFKHSRFIDEIEPSLIEIKHFTMPSPKQYANHYDESYNIKVGCMIRHKDYGTGKVMSIEPKSGKHLITIDFFDNGLMQFIMEYTKLEIIE